MRKQESRNDVSKNMRADLVGMRVRLRTGKSCDRVGYGCLRFLIWNII